LQQEKDDSTNPKFFPGSFGEEPSFHGICVIIIAEVILMKKQRIYLYAMLSLIILSSCTSQPTTDDTYTLYVESSPISYPTDLPEEEAPYHDIAFRPLGPSQVQEALCVTELMGNNPWLGYSGTIEKLPIFANQIFANYVPFYHYEANNKIAFTEEDMVELVKEAALAIGWTIYEMEVKSHSLGHIEVIAHMDEGRRIDIWRNAKALVFTFEDDLELTRGIYGRTKEEAEETVKYLVERFSHALNMKNPTPSITKSYSFNGEYLIEYRAFDAGDGDIVDAIVGYNFSGVNFWMSPYFDERGQSDRMRLHMRLNLPQLSISQPIGEYPIITADEARRLLLEGFYTSTIGEMHWPGDELALQAPVELMYLTGQFYDVFMPYYVFRIEIPEHISGRQMAESWPERLEEQKSFGWWWVPAIQEAYLPYPPLREIMFN